MYPYGTAGAYGSATGDSSSEDELKLALIKGRWSFSVRPQNTPVVFEASSLLYADVPAWAARPWTINLCAFRYQQGDIVAGSPPDNQTLTIPKYRARVVWGVDGSSETALVDYYAHGCTLQVHAGNVRVDVLAVVASASPTAPLPKLSGFLTPTARASLGPIMSPTLTTGVQALLAATQVDLPIAERAVAYRVIFLSAPGTPLINTAQRSSTSQVQEDFQQDPATYFQQGNRQAYIPLHPEAQFVRVINTGGVAQSVALSFLLDMG